MNAARLMLLFFFGALAGCQEKHAPSSFQEVDENLFKEKSKSGVAVLLIYSENCHYCPKYVPTLKKVAKDYPQVTFLKTSTPGDWAQAKTPGGTPALNIYLDGKFQYYLTGIFPEDEIKAEIDRIQAKID